MEWGLVAVPQSRSQRTCSQVLGRNEWGGLYYGFFLWGWQSRSFVLCLQEEKNSLLWLIVALSGLNKIKYFSVRQSRHMLLTGLKPGACASCLNLIDHWTFWSFKSQIYLDKQVAVLFAFVSVLKLALWLFHLSFQLGSLNQFCQCHAVSRPPGILHYQGHIYIYLLLLADPATVVRLRGRKTASGLPATKQLGFQCPL